MKELLVLEPCQKELRRLPNKIHEKLESLLVLLCGGRTFSMPICKRLKGLGANVFEFRLKDRQSIFRVVFSIKNEKIYLVHAFQKKTQKMPILSKEVIKKRLRSIK